MRDPSRTAWLRRSRRLYVASDISGLVLDACADLAFPGHLQTQLSQTSRLIRYPLDPPAPGTALSADQVSFLAPFLHPQYLEPAVLGAIGSQFANDSFLLLDKFLHPDLAPGLEVGLIELDVKHGLERDSRAGLIPDMRAGDGDEGWEVVGPSTRQRFLSLKPTTEATGATAGATATVQTLLSKVLPSDAFRAWLALLTGFPPLAHRLEARRLRPGLDYTLARGEEGGESRLDVRLGLTPGDKWEDLDGGEAFGGWEVSQHFHWSTSTLRAHFVFLPRRPISLRRTRTKTQRSTRHQSRRLGEPTARMRPAMGATTTRTMRRMTGRC